MNEHDYRHIPDLEHVFLEDSYVLDVQEGPSSLEFLLDLVLTEDHPHYTFPPPDEQYCYRKAFLTFSNIHDVRWLNRTMRPYRDATGSIDYGNIDELVLEDGYYRLSGDWGSVEVESSTPTVHLVEEVEAGGRNG